MKFTIDTAARLYDELIREGYNPELSAVICTRYMNTEYTAGRMLAYLARAGNPPEEELVDEMLAILEDRDRFVKKHETESGQAAISAWYESR